MASEKSGGGSDFNWKDFEAEAVERLLNGEDCEDKHNSILPLLS